MILFTPLDYIITANLEKKFDPNANLITTNHITDRYPEETYITHEIPVTPELTIHNLEDSAKYALFLILKDKKEDAEQAIKIINAILPLQVLDMEDLNYGIFPAYMEGVKNYHTDATRRIALFFLGIVQHNSKYISKSLTERIENSIHAAFFFSLNNEKTVRYEGSIHQLHCIFAYFEYGHLYKLDEYINVAFNMLNTYYNTIKFNGSFWEYNSHYDIYNTIIYISYIKKYIDKHKNNDMLKELANLLWESIANNFHSSMNILTGAYSNSCEHISDELFYDFLSNCFGTKKKSTLNTELIDIPKCPIQYQLIAKSPNPDRFVRKEISKGSNSHFFTLAHIASNYLRPDYSIGTFNREEMGRIHAPFNGYIKADDGKPPFNFRIHVLNNRNPFSSAEFHSIQQNGFILAHIFLNTNRGNINQSVDITNGKITTSDFRIRFEITGNINDLDIAVSNRTLTIAYNKVKLTYDISFIEFGNIPIKFHSDRTDTRFFFDAILDIPENYEFEFSKLEKAIFQFRFLISSTGKAMPETVNTFKDGFLIAEAEYENTSLRLETPYKSGIFEFSNSNSKEFINGVTLTHYVSLNKQKSTHYKNITNYGINIFPTNDSDKFFDDIDMLTKIHINKLPAFVEKILKYMIENNYNINIFKRYSIQILSVVFDRFETENIQLKKNIDISFFDIYQKISISSDNMRTANLVIKTVNDLETNFKVTSRKIKGSSTVQKVISIIDEKYLDPNLSLSMIAEMLNMNMSFISREFKNKTNISYIEYLTSKRMEAAKQMLTDGIPINDVIEKCGNHDVSSFKRAFKKHTGMTMSAWITQNK